MKFPFSFMSRVSLRVGKEDFEIQSEVPNCETKTVSTELMLQEQVHQPATNLDTVNERGKVQVVKHTNPSLLGFFWARKHYCFFFSQKQEGCLEILIQ